MVRRVRIRNEDTGEVATVGRGASRDTRQLLGSCRPRRDTQNCRGGGYPVGELRMLPVEHIDDDSKLGIWQATGVIHHDDVQIPHA